VSSASIEVESEQSVVSQAWYYSVFSFRAVIAALFIVLAVMTVRGRFNDPDLWWHLKTGQIIAQTHQIPHVDTFSYTTGHHHTVPHEWLSQLLIYAAYAAHGYTGLMLWECLMATAILLAGLYLCTIYSGEVKIAFLGTLTIWAFGSVGYAIRPQLVGYLLLAFELILLHLGRTCNPRWLLAIPPLFAIWVNCHGSFCLGLAVLGVAAFVELTGLRVPGFAPTTSQTWSRRWLPWVFAAAVAALFLNPDGLEQILYPLTIMWHSPVNLGNVQEWRRLTLNNGRTWVYIAEIVCMMALIFLRRARLTLDEFIILGYVAFEGFRHERLLFPFGILAAPIFCRLVATVAPSRQQDQQRLGLNAALIATALVTIWIAFPGERNLTQQVESTSPVQATQFIQQHHLPGPLLNSYDVGGYLIWAAPEYPVFLDGRADIFEMTGVLSAYGDWARALSPSKQLLDAYRVNLCLLDPSAAVVPQMRRLPDWKQIYADPHAIVFQRISAH
jgi:hypothetical protein